MGECVTRNSAIRQPPTNGDPGQRVANPSSGGSDGWSSGVTACAMVCLSYGTTVADKWYVEGGKRVIYNPIGQAKSMFISHSNIQNHFCLKLSSFGELKC